MATIFRCVSCFCIMDAEGNSTGTDKVHLKKKDHISLDQCNNCKQKLQYNERDIYYEGKSKKEVLYENCIRV